MAAGAVPPRTVEQRMVALAAGNRIRTFRAQLKVELREGRQRAGDVLARPPAEVETMKVFDLMLAAPKMGRVKVNKILSRNAISPSKTIGGLSSRQRAALVAALGASR